jgi:hypothetical protein
MLHNSHGKILIREHCNLILIPIGVTKYGSHYFKAKFLKKSLNNTKFERIAKSLSILSKFILLQAFFFLFYGEMCKKKSPRV